MSNPAGINQADRFGTQQYGSIARLTQLTKEAPMSGAPMSGSALGAPKKAQKRAVRGAPALGPATPPQSASPVASPMPQVPVVGQTPGQTPSGPGPHSLYMAQVWGDIASVVGASPLVQELAQRAQRQVGMGG